MTQPDPTPREDAASPIKIWEFYQSPKELRWHGNGGDEDFLILVPPKMSCPWPLRNLGCSSNDAFLVREDGQVVEESEYLGKDEYGPEKPVDGWILDKSYVGCTIIISAHA